MEQLLRVAYFPDTYEEIDGVANTSRQFEAFARKRGLPFLIVCGGAEDSVHVDGAATRITCRRGPIAFHLDKKHRFDLAFWRHYRRVARAVSKFAPDIVHITGPSDAGQLGAFVAGRLHVPIAASWHTNLHEYAERRASTLLRALPSGFREKTGAAVRDSSLAALLWFYRFAKVLFAPNPQLVEMLEKGTGKPVRPMHRGVDTHLFAPERRDRRDDDFVVGYVGRLTIEKNIRFLAELESSLGQSGLRNVRFVIVGQGAEESWLRTNMRNAELPGVLRGEALARAYANMDGFAFPSRTDTFGNVVLEALASGVPAIVTDAGGPQFLVTPGETGFVAPNAAEFVACVRRLIENPEKLREMRRAARAAALEASWDQIFEGLYSDYENGLRLGQPVPGISIKERFEPNATCKTTQSLRVVDAPGDDFCSRAPVNGTAIAHADRDRQPPGKQKPAAA
jgi:phosphatidylinositol alpha 1,6-mannosyltransferase